MFLPPNYYIVGVLIQFKLIVVYLSLLQPVYYPFKELPYFFYILILLSLRIQGNIERLYLGLKNIYQSVLDPTGLPIQVYLAFQTRGIVSTSLDPLLSCLFTPFSIFYQEIYIPPSNYLFNPQQGSLFQVLLREDNYFIV